MYLTDLYPISTACIQLASICLQFKYNKTRKSIRGLSYDYSLLQFLTHLISIASLLSFCSSTITSQYMLRWSSETPHISLLVLVLEVISFIVSTGMIIQLIIYKSTRGQNQAISGYCQGFIITVLLPLVYLFKLWLFKQAKINELDLVDYGWTMFKLFTNLRFIPQVMVNWMDDSVDGLYPYWIHLQVACAAFELVDRVVNGYVWADVSIMMPSLPLIIIKDVSIAIIGFQYHVYRKRTSEVHYKEV
ncbi:putative integral membrane protein [Candida parapsilosis]|uniref:Uncharacterized protein n=2 Tax=Candida parapsilosis TaxID=5480 RepID=G8BAB4_CANPC|nr:uncharacterized protein CPAR2_805360 [Candida parapsilosis]KAF6051886.1 putative integral membrane protein [Candida parapsilosis]KAF6052617.1 putative integral membrane protein [Candida parapsilosis]KAF6053688.1 hypothetical protein FOB59_001970 [Candida parapsilosis]KAF6064393.1 putative integral membrane protein [Candida parapsilosis]CAD1810903.1 unnamed protein product [Candida parapsilosis]